MFRLIWFFIGVRLFAFESIYQLSFSGSGSHLLNVYLANLLETRVENHGLDGKKPYDYVNQFFGWKKNPNAPEYVRTHYVECLPKCHDGVFLILVLRDYKEVFFSRVNNGLERGRIDRFTKKIPDYFRALEAFRRWDGAKMLVHYEDLIADPRKVVGEIASKIGVWAKMEDCESQVERMFSIYQGSPVSRGKGPHFHMARQPIQFVKIMDDLVRSEHPELFAQFLRRYDGF